MDPNSKYFNKEWFDLDLKEKTKSEIARIISRLRKRQSADGSWRYCFESGIMNDAYMIILLRSLNMDDQDLIRMLSERIAAKQEDNGAWKLFHDEADGNLSTTIEAYYALLYSGCCRMSDDNIQTARQFIISKGGLSEAGMLTKMVLALTGQYPWPKHLPIPLEIILLPYWFPLNFFDLVGYARVHIAPILIAADRKPAIRNNSTPDLSHLLMNKTGFRGTQNRTRLLKIRPILSAIKQTIGALPYTPQQIHTHALQRAERFILDRIEWDGTLYSYFSATFLMVFSLLALGYSKKHPVITRSIDGLKALIGAVEGRQIHIQNSTSTVWDTALLCYALQEANVSITDPMIQKAGQYLYARQHDRYGDWIIHNPGVIPGGWGFSDINTINPDVDDTTACLRAIRRLAKKDQTYHRAWKRGLNWLMSMQNDDGGWPAFEKNTDKKILTLLPFEGADAVSIDPSSADLTGRTLEFLGAHAGLTVENRRIEKAVNWLIKHQQADGSWYGRWGVSYIYGTWAAVTGMRAVGISSHHPAIQKAVQWLLNIQNEDGGWGESCRSDTEKKYTPLGRSTPSQTAWALDALIAASREPADAMERGMHFLIESGAKNDWTTSYPTGAGLPGGFYIHYHSYRYIWPLLAFSHYVKKYSS